MDIKLIKAENGLDAELILLLSYEDIRENAEKNLHTSKQKMNLPGFRKGKIPLNIAKNYLWEGIIRDELEKTLEKTINEYFKENNLEFLKPLLPVNTDSPIDLKNFSSHEFKYEVGLVNKVEFDPEILLKDIKRYTVPVAEKDVEEETERILDAYGSYSSPETPAGNDEIKVYLECVELNAEMLPLEGGVSKKVAKRMGDVPEAFKALIADKKKDESFDVNIDEVFADRDVFADFFQLEKLAAKDLNPVLRIKIISIHLHEKAELNAELISRFTQGTATNEEEFKKHVEVLLKSSYNRQSDSQLFDQIYHCLLETNPIALPDGFINKLFEAENAEKKEKLTEEEIPKELENLRNKIRWQLINTYLSEKYKLEVSEQEIMREAYVFVSSYFYQYGIQDMKPEKMAEHVRDYLKTTDNVLYIRERVITGKIFDKIKTDITFATEEISLEELKKLEHHHH